MHTSSTQGNRHSPKGAGITGTIARLIVCLAFAILPLVPSTFAFAIAHPDSTPSISDIHANRNLVETGDLLIYGQYDIPYAGWASLGVNADRSFIIRLLDPTGVTELGAITPYVYFHNGYDEGIFSFYFPAATAPAWGLAYIIRISENPAHFLSPVSTDTVMPISSSTYTILTSQADNRADLTSNLITLGHNLESIYSVTLFTTSGSRTVLSSPYGTGYIRGAVYGIQAMAPSLFVVQVAALDLTSTNWTTTQFDVYEHRFDGTWVGTAQNATASQLGTTPQMAMSMIFVVPFMIGAVVFTAMKWKRIEPGLITCAVILIMAVLMGWLPKAIFASLNQFMAIYLAYVLFYARG